MITDAGRRDGPRAPRGSSAPPVPSTSSPGSVRSRLPVARSTCRAASRSGAAPSRATSTPVGDQRARARAPASTLVLAGAGTRRPSPAASATSRLRAITRAKSSAQPVRDHPARRAVAHRDDRARRRQDRLRRDAAPVAAHAAGALALDHRRAETELRGADRRHVAARARAHDDQVVVGTHTRPASASGASRSADELAQEASGEHAVDDAMIARQRHGHDAAPGRPAPSRTTGTARTVPTARMAGLRRIHDRREVRHREHAEVRDRERAAGRSSAANFPARARSTSPRTCATSAPSGWRSQSRTTGTTRPVVGRGGDADVRRRRAGRSRRRRGARSSPARARSASADRLQHEVRVR